MQEERRRAARTKRRNAKKHKLTKSRAGFNNNKQMSKQDVLTKLLSPPLSGDLVKSYLLSSGMAGAMNRWRVDGPGKGDPVKILTLFTPLPKFRVFAAHGGRKRQTFHYRKKA
jgi:hypothetical protein